MTMDKLSSLPLEIILIILSHLPLKSLLAYGETSRKNYENHITSLRSLRIAVFQKRIHSMVSYLQAGWTTPGQTSTSGGMSNGGAELPYKITIIHPQLPFDTKFACLNRHFQSSELRTASPLGHYPNVLLRRMIQIQNELFACFAKKYGRSLLDLEFMAYDLDTVGAQTLGRHCKSLRKLALRFEHPHVRDGFTKPTTWLKPAPGSTAWNSLIGIGPSDKHRAMKLTGLETLVMERAGITPWQLMMLVRNNPNLTTLKLRTCSGVQPEFLEWLGGTEGEFQERGPECDGEEAPGARLKVLWLENSQHILDRTVEDFDKLPDEICDFGLEWVRGLSSLKVCFYHVSRSRLGLANVLDSLSPSMSVASSPQNMSTEPTRLSGEFQR